MAATKKNVFKAATDKRKQQQAAIVNEEPEAAQASPAAEDKPNSDDADKKVGLNLRIARERRAFIKSWAALNDTPMNELFEKVIDQIQSGAYNPLDR